MAHIQSLLQEQEADERWVLTLASPTVQILYTVHSSAGQSLHLLSEQRSAVVKEELRTSGKECDPCLSCHRGLKDEAFSNASFSSVAQRAAAHPLQGKAARRGATSSWIPVVPSPRSPLTYYALLVVACLVHLPHEELQTNNGIDDDDEQH